MCFASPLKCLPILATIHFNVKGSKEKLGQFKEVKTAKSISSLLSIMFPFSAIRCFSVSNQCRPHLEHISSSVNSGTSSDLTLIILLYSREWLLKFLSLKRYKLQWSRCAFFSSTLNCATYSSVVCRVFTNFSKMKCIFCCFFAGIIKKWICFIAVVTCGWWRINNILEFWVCNVVNVSVNSLLSPHSSRI